MARMQTQVEKMISNARAREHAGVNPALQGALGHLSGRTNKAAPRQKLQVSSNGALSSPSLASAQPVKSHEEHHRVAQAAGKLGREVMKNMDGQTGIVAPSAPLTHRQAQAAAEALYDILLAIEQMNREAPAADGGQARANWEAAHAKLVDDLWSRSLIMVPVETSDPHPFISLLNLQKGKRLIPRIIRLLPEAKVMLLLVLLVACFHQLDVVREAYVLDNLQGPASPRWKHVSEATDAILIMLPSTISVLVTASLRLLTGLLNIMMGNGIVAVLQVVKSQPGILLLTAFMSRVDQLRHEDNSGTDEDWAKWQSAFENFVSLLRGNILSLFPSRRLAVSAGTSSIPNIDLADQIVWQFLAALSAIGTQQQQMWVVAEVREMILQSVQAVHSGWVVDPEEAALKLGNVDILLRAMGLDHSRLKRK